MMDEIMRQEERILLNQIAKLTEEGHLAWAFCGASLFGAPAPFPKSGGQQWPHGH